jgi:hypothetical protein
MVPEERTVTLFLTSCGRPDLLMKTMESFLKFNTYPIKEAIITEDSGNAGINDFLYDMLPFPCRILYNTERLGQMKSIENGLQYINTPYVFHCEEDWEFYDSGFIEKSFEILDKNDKITSVWLRSHDELINRYNFHISQVPNENYYIVGPNTGNFSWNPGLRKTEIQKAYAPYPEVFCEGKLSEAFRNRGFVSALTDNKNGYVQHIGWDRHVW